VVGLQPLDWSLTCRSNDEYRVVDIECNTAKPLDPFLASHIFRFPPLYHCLSLSLSRSTSPLYYKNNSAMPSLLTLLHILSFLPSPSPTQQPTSASNPWVSPAAVSPHPTTPLLNSHKHQIVYMCRGFDWTSANAYCTWVPPSLTSSCYTFQGDRHNRPLSIGPDPGGHCDLFFGPKCDGWKVKVPSEGWDESTA
jgi:hypothetical protein